LFLHTAIWISSVDNVVKISRERIATRGIWNECTIHTLNNSTVGTGPGDVVSLMEEKMDLFTISSIPLPVSSVWHRKNGGNDGNGGKGG